jgi:hypothetical protein
MIGHRPVGIRNILRMDAPDKLDWGITFLLTVVADLTLAVEVGMALAALLYIYRVSQTTTVSTVTPEYIRDGRVHIPQDKDVPPFAEACLRGGLWFTGELNRGACSRGTQERQRSLCERTVSASAPGPRLEARAMA